MSGALGELRPSPTAEMVATIFGRSEADFVEFVNDTTRGLVRITGDKVEILAVQSKEDGKGYFRSLIERLKSEYRVVEILVVLEPRLDAVLRRYGFKRFSRRERDGEKVRGWRWKGRSK